MLSRDRQILDCNSTMNQQICRFYSNGFCKYFDKCKYSHELGIKTDNTAEISTTSNLRRKGRLQNFHGRPRFERFNYMGERNTFGETRKTVSETLNRECKEIGVNMDELFRSPIYFYKHTPVSWSPRWRNARGNRYRKSVSKQNNSKNTSHPKKDIDKDEQIETLKSNEETDPSKKLRQTEIQQFQKRFSKHKNITEGVFHIEYFPTDPDWPFEVKSINLKVEFPNEYPKTSFLVIVLNEDDVLPDMLVKHLNRTIREWISDRWEKNNGKIELAFRPFLRWLDKNLENLFISGLRLTKQDIETKAAGIEFVPHEMLCNPKMDSLLDQNKSSNDNDLSNDTCENYQIIEKSDILCSKSEETADENKDIINITKELSIEDPPQINKSNIIGLKTEIKFKDLYLAEHAATLSCQKLQVVIMCDRCKTRHDLTTLANRLNLATCTKCQQVQELTFQPSLLHPHSFILGYVHLLHCQIIDLPLISCEFSISCLNCSRQCNLSGIHYSLQRITWCPFCNSKMSVTIQGVRFLHLQANETLEKYQTHSVKLNSKFVKNQILPVQLGKPLPANGTCKHYKQSFRWLRFPCCGKAYPCDICHNEKESDHEMKLATRMICGFCAREQPYTKDKECIGCNAYVTKKSSTHWEGGKGCRDKIKMSKTDKHKYCGTNKTKSVKKVSGNVKSVQ